MPNPDEAGPAVTKAPEPFEVKAAEDGSFALKCNGCGNVKAWRGKPPWMEVCESGGPAVEATRVDAVTQDDLDWLAKLAEPCPGAYQSSPAARQSRRAARILAALSPSSPPDEPPRKSSHDPCDFCGFDADDIAGSVLMRVFDDGDEAMQEWLAYPRRRFFTPERALGAFIRNRSQTNAKPSGVRFYSREDLEAVAREAEKRWCPHDDCISCESRAAEVVTRYLQTREK